MRCTPHSSSDTGGSHPFIDGNKRIGFASADVFLRINGYRIDSAAADIYARMIEMFESGTFALARLEPWLRSIVVDDR